MAIEQEIKKEAGKFMYTLSDEEALEMIKRINHQPLCVMKNEHKNRMVIRNDELYMDEVIHMLLNYYAEVTIKKVDDEHIELSWGDK